MKKKLFFLVPALALLLTGCQPEEVWTSKPSSNTENSSLVENSSADNENSSANPSTSDDESADSTSGSYVELPFI